MITMILAASAFLYANWGTIEAVLGVGGLLHILALFVVNFTNTPKDDEAVAKFYKAIEVVAGVMTRKAKQ